MRFKRHEFTKQNIQQIGEARIATLKNFTVKGRAIRGKLFIQIWRKPFNHESFFDIKVKMIRSTTKNFKRIRITRAITGKAMIKNSRF